MELISRLRAYPRMASLLDSLPPKVLALSFSRAAVPVPRLLTASRPIIGSPAPKLSGSAALR